MAGILNNKERMIDFLVTEHGKDQIVQGRLRPVFASLTDSHTFYQASSSLEPNVAEDASNRIFFEATNRHQDTLVPEILAGNVMKIMKDDAFTVAGSVMAAGTFMSGSTEIVGDLLTGSALFDASEKFLGRIATNFRDHRLLSTKDRHSDSTDFKLSAHTASFVIVDPPEDVDVFAYKDYVISESVNLENQAPISQDWRFKHLPNFKYLPPINPDSGDTLGNYPELDSYPKSPGYTDGTELSLAKEGHPSIDYNTFYQTVTEAYQKVTVEYKDTSSENNLFGQVYSVSSPGGFEKLSVVDLGVFYDESPSSLSSQTFIDSESPYRHIFAVGRVDETMASGGGTGASVFVGLFYLIFD